MCIRDRVNGERYETKVLKSEYCTSYCVTQLFDMVKQKYVFKLIFITVPSIPPFEIQTVLCYKYLFPLWTPTAGRKVNRVY